MEAPESTQRHTNVRLKQIELVLFTLCNESFVFCEMAAEISRAQVMVRRQITRSICIRSICRIGPVIGIGLHVGSTLVVSPTYEPQHYKALQSKQKDLCAQRRLRSIRASAQSDQSLRSAHNG